MLIVPRIIIPDVAFSLSINTAINKPPVIGLLFYRSYVISVGSSNPYIFFITHFKREKSCVFSRKKFFRRIESNVEVSLKRIL